MKRLLPFFATALLLQSCVKEVISPFDQSNTWENKYWLITNDSEICFNWTDRNYLVYENLQSVDSIQWHVSGNLGYQILDDTLRLIDINSSGDTAFISLLTFTNSDTLELQVTVYDCFQTVYIPSGFTPDGDYLNDEWYPIITNVEEMSWTIHSDEGHLVFDSDGDLTARWDGTWNGNPAPEGLYRYDLTYWSLIDSLYIHRNDWLQLYRSE